MFLTILSIWLISFIAALWNKLSYLKLCPICAGVSGTWIMFIALKFMGYEVNPVILALLLGGSVVGFSYKADKFVGSKKIMAWKLAFIPVGFLAAYDLVYFSPRIFIWLAVLAVIVYMFIFYKAKTREKEKDNIKNLEEKMKNCC